MRLTFPRLAAAGRCVRATAGFAVLAWGVTAAPPCAVAQEAVPEKEKVQEEKAPEKPDKATPRQKTEDSEARQKRQQKREQAGRQEQEQADEPRESGQAERDSNVRAELGVILAPGEEGIRIVRVRPDGPADEAGLERGDVLISVDGKKLSTPREAIEHLASHQPGEECRIEYRRDGETDTTEVTLGKARVLELPRLPFQARARETAWLGALLFEDRGNGAMVATVFPSGPANEAGLRMGDNIVRADDEDIEGPRDLEEVLEDAEPDETIELTVHRDGEAKTLDVKLGRHVIVQLVPNRRGDRDDRSRDEGFDERDDFGWDEFADDMREPRGFRAAHDELFRIQEQLQDEVRHLREQLNDLRGEMRRMRDDGPQRRGRERRESEGERTRTEV